MHFQNEDIFKCKIICKNECHLNEKKKKLKIIFLIITTFALNLALKQRPLGNPEMAFFKIFEDTLLRTNKTYNY